jgi:hypothetical protein
MVYPMSQDSNVRQPVAEPCQDQQTDKPRDYDMDDSQNDFQRWPKLAPILCDLGNTVVKAYHRVDLTARKDRAWHNAATIVAALGGMFAVLFAIVQLTPVLPFVVLRPDSVKHLEPMAAFVALLAVVLGLWAAVSKKWLVEREKAERYRFLKFSLLISPEWWGNDPTPGGRQDQFCRRLERIRTLNWQTLRHSVARGDKPYENATSSVAASIDKEIDEETLGQLLDYYQEKRLCYQLQYLERQAERRRRWDQLTRILPLWLFFASIGAALLHFLYDIDLFYNLLVEPLLNTFPALTPEEIKVGVETQQGSYAAGEYDTVTLLLLMLAACLPVIGAALRLLRTAHEFGRNTLRFRATLDKLKQLRSSLQRKADPQSKLEILQKIEEALEAERSEWLHLMIDAEWFG